MYNDNFFYRPKRETCELKIDKSYSFPHEEDKSSFSSLKKDETVHTSKLINISYLYENNE